MATCASAAANVLKMGVSVLLCIPCAIVGLAICVPVGLVAPFAMIPRVSCSKFVHDYAATMILSVSMVLVACAMLPHNLLSGTSIGSQLKGLS